MSDGAVPPTPTKWCAAVVECEPCSLLGFPRPAVAYRGVDDTPCCLYHLNYDWSSVPPVTDYEAAIREVRARYPEDVFPSDSKLLDGMMGTFARHLCDQIVEVAEGRGGW